MDLEIEQLNKSTRDLVQSLGGTYCREFSPKETTCIFVNVCVCFCVG